MFKNQYQTGVSMSLVNCTGAGPNLFYKAWKVRGCVTRGYDSSAKSYTFRFEGPKPPQVSLPRDELRSQGLMILQPLIAFQVWLSMCPELHIELVVTDTNGVRRRLFFSDGVKELQVTELHSRIPIPPTQLSRGKWINLALHVHAFFAYCYPTLTFRSIDYFSIAGFFKLKRIFTLRDIPAASGPYCIQALYPGADLNKAEHIPCKNLQFGPGILGLNVTITPPLPERNEDQSPLDYMYHSEMEVDASTITDEHQKFPSLEQQRSPSQSPIATQMSTIQLQGSRQNSLSQNPEQLTFPRLQQDKNNHLRHVSEPESAKGILKDKRVKRLSSKAQITGFSNASSGMSNTFNTNQNSPFRVVGSGANLHQKRKSIHPGSAYSVGTEEGFSSSTNLDATLRGLKKQIHQNRNVRGAAQSATQHRKGDLSPLPLIKPNRIKRQSIISKENDISSIKLPPLDSHGETDSIAEVVNKFPTVHKRSKNKTPPHKPDPFTPYRTPVIRESERLTPVKQSRGGQKKVSRSKTTRAKNQVSSHNSATQLSPMKGAKLMKREFSKILEKGEEFEVRRSQSSLKVDQLQAGKANNQTPHLTPEQTPEENQRIDRKNRAKRNPLASKVYKSQQRKFEEGAETAKREGDPVAKASSIRASKLTAYEQIQLRPRKTTRSQKAQDRSSAATDQLQENDLISPYKPKRPRAQYDNRGHRIKAPVTDKKHFKNSDLQISPWSQEERSAQNGSVTSPKVKSPHRNMTNNSQNNNFQEDSADSRFNTHTFYLYKQKMEALKNKQNLNTSGAQNLSTAGMGIISGPEPIMDDEDSEIEQEIHEIPDQNPHRMDGYKQMQKMSGLVLNKESPEVPEEDMSTQGPNKKFGQSTFYELEHMPLQRPYSPPFAGASPLPKSHQKPPYSPRKMQMQFRAMPSLSTTKPDIGVQKKNRQPQLERVTTDLLKRADDILGVKFDLEKQCYVDTKTKQIYNLYE